MREPIHYKVEQTGANSAVDIQIGKTSESSVLIDPKILYMYVIYILTPIHPGRDGNGLNPSGFVVPNPNS